MILTDQQMQGIATAVRAEPSLADAVANRLDDDIRGWCNAAASPAYTVWRTSVSQDEIMLNGFDWTRVDNLSVGKARVWEWLFDNDAKSINPSKINVRAGIDQTWTGGAADQAVRAAVYTHCKRTVSNVERIFCAGTGSDAVPGTVGPEGPITTNEVSFILNTY